MLTSLLHITGMNRFLLGGYVALGGAVGSVARYVIAVVVPTRPGAFPAGTLLVNVSGSILIGFLMRYGLESISASAETRLLLVTGFCGGYTTFSAFSYETARLLEDGQWTRGVAYIAASVVLSIAGTFAGFAIARGMLGAQG